MSGFKKKVRVGITMGDPAGIGTEIILKIFRDKNLLDLCTPVIFGSPKVFTAHKSHFKYQTNFQTITSLEKLPDNKLSLFSAAPEDGSQVPEFGVSSNHGAKSAYSALKIAVEALKSNSIDVLVTTPIHKESMMEAGMEFPGHTEFLEKELGGKSLMVLAEENLRVALLSHHIPLKNVPSSVTSEKIKQCVKAFSASLIQDFQIQKPKIAVLGLNPHAGDGGKIGTEELEIISPTLVALRENGHLVFGPFAADSFFQPKNVSLYDGVLAMYHDQGLVAFKTLHYNDGVNYTAGLPYVRTSPDHGVGYDIAGKGVADTQSFLHAIYMAIDIYQRRTEYQELIGNALQTTSHK